MIEYSDNRVAHAFVVEKIGGRLYRICDSQPYYWSSLIRHKDRNIFCFEASIVIYAGKKLT
jgi:hypothetical protein